MEVLPFGLPLGEGHASEVDGFAVGAPIEIAIELVLVAGPVAAEEGRIFPEDDVVFEGE